MRTQQLTYCPQLHMATYMALIAAIENWIGITLPSKAFSPAHNFITMRPDL